MTDEELNAIEARANVATPGPWLMRESEDIGDRVVEAISAVKGPLFEDIVKTDSGTYPPGLNDAAFIAAARDDVPALVAEVRALKEQIANLDLRLLPACSKCGLRFVPWRGCYRSVCKRCIDTHGDPGW